MHGQKCSRHFNQKKKRTGESLSIQFMCVRLSQCILKRHIFSVMYITNILPPSQKKANLDMDLTLPRTTNLDMLYVQALYSKKERSSVPQQ